MGDRHGDERDAMAEAMELVRGADFGGTTGEAADVALAMLTVAGYEVVPRRSPGVSLIAEERHRQLEVEGWTPEHDDQHPVGDLLDAARCYLMAGVWSVVLGEAMPKGARDTVAPWPWHEDWWKPSVDPVRNVTKAGALLAAEIDRLERVKTRGDDRG